MSLDKYPINANVLDLKNSILDDHLMIDTNSFLYALVYDKCMQNNLIENKAANRSLSTDYIDFLDRIIQEGKEIYITPIQKREIENNIGNFFAHKKAKEIGKNNYRKKKIYRNYPTLISERNNFINKVNKVVDSFGLITNIGIIEETEYSTYIYDRLRKETILDTNDAQIISTGIDLGINSFISHDSEFARVEGINLYTSNLNLLKKQNNSTSNLLSYDSTEQIYTIDKNN